MTRELGSAASKGFNSGAKASFRLGRKTRITTKAQRSPRRNPRKNKFCLAGGSQNRAALRAPAKLPGEPKEWLLVFLVRPTRVIMVQLWAIGFAWRIRT